jgi:hypothetical protein
MLDFIMNRREKINRDLLDIESILQTSLKPVSPRPEFIQNLHRGLMEYTFPRPESSDVDIKKAIIFAFLGLLGTAFVISLWIRLIVVIISALGMIQSSKGKKGTNQSIK